MLDARKELILKLVIEDYIRTAEPVGSKYLNEQYQLGVSPATVRNDMAALEAEDFLRAPHTSSGRIPTERAYVYYLSHLRDKKLKLESGSLQGGTQDARNAESALKAMAKKLVEISGETAILAFDPNWSYYIGVSNLFGKPDFHDLELVQSLSALVDQFDEVIHEIYARVPDEPLVLIGSGNPFGHQMATILVRYRMGEDGHGLLGLMGPLRMDYSRNLALVERAKEIIDAYDYE
ncbi:hypothetical protein HZA87_03350 [Candidatus Uhrbacteria bacterium]|nr:hypothetical protein [Candidatus Uhrbacteria bacterium]